MDKERKSEIHITNNFNAPIGQHINHVDTINFRMDGDGTFHFDMVEHAKHCGDGSDDPIFDENCITQNRPHDPQPSVKESLMPLFYNNEEDVRLFLKQIAGMKPQDITDLVNRWVKEKRISDYGISRKGTLWGILHEAGLYTRSKQNWNRRVY